MVEAGAISEPCCQDWLLAAAAEAPWLPGAAPGLAMRRWKLLERDTGLTEATYGTARVLAESVDAPRIVRADIALPAGFGRKRPLIVEDLPHVDAYACIGLGFARLTPAATAAATDRLLEAFGVVDRVGGLARAVGGVLSALHVLEAPGPDHDASFSDPNVPFSAFVGISESRGPHASVRLAEQIVHECMHLQLTLVEAVHPMVSADVEAHRSPWQGTMRPTRGVLHGLYVFRVLDAFFAQLAWNVVLDLDDAEHLKRRRQEIASETADAAESMSRSAELTPFGRAFLDAILVPWKARP